MRLRAWRFATLLLAALSLGLSFAHLLEFPPRVFWFDADLWIAVTTGGLYAMFGTVGEVIELRAILFAAGLVFLVRRRPAVSPRCVADLRPARHAGERPARRRSRRPDDPRGRRRLTAFAGS